jgi:hypothetical protein
MSEAYDAIDGLGSPYAIHLYGSDLIEPGTILAVNPVTLRMEPVNLAPVTTRGQAAKIVQEGLSDVLEWLRRAGHDLPHWSTIDTRQQFAETIPDLIRAEVRYGLEQHYRARFHPSSLVKGTGL